MTRAATVCEPIFWDIMHGKFFYLLLEKPLLQGVLKFESSLHSSHLYPNMYIFFVKWPPLYKPRDF